MSQTTPSNSWTPRKREYLIYLIATKMLYVERYGGSGKQRWGKLATDHRHRLVMLNTELKLQQAYGLNTDLESTPLELLTYISQIINSFRYDKNDEQLMIWLQSGISDTKTRNHFQVGWDRLYIAKSVSQHYQPTICLPPKQLYNVWRFISTYYDSHHYQKPIVIDPKLFRNLNQNIV